MTAGRILLFALIFKGHADRFYISDISSEWEEIDDTCSLAVPHIRHTKTGIVVDINITLADDENAWVGYVKKQQSFDYIDRHALKGQGHISPRVFDFQGKVTTARLYKGGLHGNFDRPTGYLNFGKSLVFDCKGCFKQSSLDMIQSESVTVDGPGQCFDLCTRMSTFGLSGNECFCFKDVSSLADVRSNYTSCTTECDTNTGVVCGNKMDNGTRYISIYKEYQKDVTYNQAENDVEAHCLKENTDDIFVWANCFEKVKVVCYFRNSKKTCMKTSTSGSFETWIENTKQCFANGGSPLRIRECHYSDQENKSELIPAWTNFIRSYIISSNIKTAVESIIQYGFVENQGGKNVLRFTNNSSRIKKIICSKEQRSNISIEARMLLYITVTVAVVLVIILVVSLIVVFKKRQKHKQRLEMRNSSHYDNPVISFTANDEEIRPAQVEEINGQGQNNQYEEVHLEVESNNMQTHEEITAIQRKCEGRRSAYERIDDVISKQEFDQNVEEKPNSDDSVPNYYILEKPLQMVKNSKDELTESTEQTTRDNDINVYNKLVTDIEQTYDHAFQVKRNMRSASDKTYNTTAPCVAQ